LVVAVQLLLLLLHLVRLGLQAQLLLLLPAAI
jgi:hypothetical protein